MNGWGTESAPIGRDGLDLEFGTRTRHSGARASNTTVILRPAGNVRIFDFGRPIHLADSIAHHLRFLQTTPDKCRALLASLARLGLPDRQGVSAGDENQPLMGV